MMAPAPRCKLEFSVLFCSQGESHEAAVARGRTEIAGLVETLRMTNANDIIEGAHRLYKLALQHGFTRGRRVNQVTALPSACFATAQSTTWAI